MKIFCITGAPGSDLEMVASILADAGIRPALPSQQDDSISMQSWHEHVLSATSEDDEDAKPVEEIGKFWEQLASSLFVANLKAPLWSWAESRSTWLMDYWRKFDPNVRFVLVYTPPHRALASALAAREVEGESIATLLETWASYNRELLRFHKKNPKKCILVNAQECAANPAALIQACSTRWKLSLTTDEVEPQPSFSPKPLATYLAEQSLVIQPELKLLQDEMDAAVHSLVDDANPHTPFNIFDALKDYSALRDMAVHARSLSEQQAVLAAQVSDLERAVADRSAIESELASYRKRLEDASKENAQILLQMHQLQEELERRFLESKKLSDDNSALKNELAAARTSASNNVQQLAAAKDLVAAREQVAKLEELGKAQSQRIQQIQASLDNANKEVAAKKSELEARSAEIQKLKAESESKANEAKKLRSDVDAANRTAKETQHENELILAQLHQVQEELETYFLQHKAAVQRNKEYEDRWLRMLARNPDYCDFRSIEAVAHDAATKRTSWKIADLNAAARSFPELSFDTLIDNGIARIALSRNGRPPAELPLEALTTSEWTLTQTLAKLLESQINAPADQAMVQLATLDESTRTALSQALVELQQQMAEFPVVLRFDNVNLKREQVNPDYEHLWLRVQNLTFGEQRIPEFEFRLSCANVRPGKFGLYPKLEFPAGAGALPFEKWYVESYDDFGDKLELRFAMPEAMDLAVWNELSERDHTFMTALIAALNSMLARLNEDGTVLARDWSEWTALAENVKRILSLRTAPAEEIPVVVEQPRLVVVQTQPVKAKAKPAKGKAPAKVKAK